MKPWSFEFATLFAVSVAALVIMLPFFNAVILGAVTAYILYPLVYGLKRYIHSYNLSVFITVILLTTAVFAFTTFAVHDAAPLVTEVSGLVDEISVIIEHLRPVLETLGLSDSVTSTQKIIETLEIYAKEQIINGLNSIPSIAISLIIYLFVTYYFLRDGIALKDMIVRYLKTLNYRDKKVGLSILDGLKNSFNVLFFAYVTMSVIIATLAWVGFELLGVPYAGLLAIISGIAVFLPIIGVSWVYLPIALYEYLIGNETIAIFVVVYGFLVLSMLPEMYLRPYVGAKIGKVHPLTILVGFFGGPVIFGIMGFIIGPIILVVAETVIRSYMILSIDISEKTQK